MTCAPGPEIRSGERGGVRSHLVRPDRRENGNAAAVVAFASRATVNRVPVLKSFGDGRDPGR
jgi:hypothetical protein